MKVHLLIAFSLGSRDLLFLTEKGANGIQGLAPPPQSPDLPRCDGNLTHERRRLFPSWWHFDQWLQSPYRRSQTAFRFFAVLMKGAVWHQLLMYVLTEKQPCGAMAAPPPLLRSVPRPPQTWSTFFFAFQTSRTEPGLCRPSLLGLQMMVGAVASASCSGRTVTGLCT